MLFRSTLASKGSLNVGGFALDQFTFPVGLPGTTGPTTSETGDVSFNHYTLASLNQSGSLPSIGGMFRDDAFQRSPSPCRSPAGSRRRPVNQPERPERRQAAS